MGRITRDGFVYRDRRIGPPAIVILWTPHPPKASRFGTGRIPRSRRRCAIDGWHIGAPIFLARIRIQLSLLKYTWPRHVAYRRHSSRQIIGQTWLRYEQSKYTNAK